VANAGQHKQAPTGKLKLPSPSVAGVRSNGGSGADGTGGGSGTSAAAVATVVRDTPAAAAATAALCRMTTAELLVPELARARQALSEWRAREAAAAGLAKALHRGLPSNALARTLADAAAAGVAVADVAVAKRALKALQARRGVHACVFAVACVFLWV
jgi:hypothetical protein